MKSACRKPCGILSTIHTPSNKLQSNVRYRRGCTQVIAHICFLPRRIQTGNGPRLQTPCRAYNANNEMRQREAMRRHTELNIGAEEPNTSWHREGSCNMFEHVCSHSHWGDINTSLKAHSHLPCSGRLKRILGAFNPRHTSLGVGLVCLRPPVQSEQSDCSRPERADLGLLASELQSQHHFQCWWLTGGVVWQVVTNKTSGRGQTWSYDEHRRLPSVSSEGAVCCSTFSRLQIPDLSRNPSIHFLFFCTRGRRGAGAYIYV